MSIVNRWPVLTFAALALCVTANGAFSQELGGRVGTSPDTPALGYSQPQTQPARVMPGVNRLTLAAQLVDQGQDLTRGMIWRVFEPEPAADGKLRLVATARGGIQSFDLPAGQYLVHASYGRAGATKRVTVSQGPKREDFVLDAGGLELDAIVENGAITSPDKLKFSIYEGTATAGTERQLIVPDVSPKAVVRLNAGNYHVVSTYGAVNAVVRSDLKVEAGKLTQATVEHHAAEVTIKLVREHGGEAIADTSWSIVGDSGDPVRESVGAYASMVLAEGDYTAVAKNRDHIFQSDFTVESGKNIEVEVLANENEPTASEGAD